MRITPLASGSLGNSLLVEAEGARLLIDAGLSLPELEDRFRAVGLRPRSLDAVVVTHRHRDHIRGVTELAHRHRLPVFATKPTARAVGSEAQRRLQRIEPEQWFAVGPLRLCAVGVPHDAPGTVAIIVHGGRARFGYATDLGRVDAELVDALRGCDGLFLEFNHDREMLLGGDDPPRLKRRIASPTGHLDNAAAAALLALVRHRALQQVWLGHLSRRNNTPRLALQAAAAAVADCPDVALQIALQDEPSPTVEIGVRAAPQPTA